jgi:hypothetical protein
MNTNQPESDTPQIDKWMRDPSSCLSFIAVARSLERQLAASQARVKELNQILIEAHSSLDKVLSKWAGYSKTTGEHGIENMAFSTLQKLKQLKEKL